MLSQMCRRGLQELFMGVRMPSGHKPGEQSAESQDESRTLSSSFWLEQTNQLAKIKCRNFTPSVSPQNWDRRCHSSGWLTLVCKAGNRKPALFPWQMGFHDPTLPPRPQFPPLCLHPPSPSSHPCPVATGTGNCSRISVIGMSNGSSF